MRRFFVSVEDLHTALENKTSLELVGDEFHHLKNVCRLEPGERVELLDGAGKIALAEIENLGKKSGSLKILNVLETPPGPKPRCDIILSVPRFQKIELIIQKCVELGAASITPVFSERSFVKVMSRDLEKKRERWSKISAEACKQSGRAWPMELRQFCHLSEALPSSGESGLFLFEGEGQQDIKSFLTQLTPMPSQIKIYIGAEGGFSIQEVELFKSKGLAPVTLGPLVLRVETACIAILSVIQYHFGLMR